MTQWHIDLEDVPWLDRPNALEALDQRRSEPVIAANYGRLHQWAKFGYCILEGAISSDEANTLAREVEAVWEAKVPILGLILEELRLAPGDPAGVPHDRLMALPRAERLRLRDEQPWRIHAFYEHSATAAALRENPRLRELVAAILDRPVAPGNTLSFMYGSRQALHQDMAVCHIVPLNFLVGAWVACEDISPAAGPLAYFPGSHREKLFIGFDNYPQTNLRTCDAATTRAYQDYANRLSAQYSKHLFLGKKGDVLLWHGMLLHGGETIADPRLTRHSFVCHFSAVGADRSDEIVGPFNW